MHSRPFSAVEGPTLFISIRERVICVLAAFDSPWTFCERFFFENEDHRLKQVVAELIRIEQEISDRESMAETESEVVNSLTSELEQESSQKVSQRPRRFGSRLMILIRRIHLYTGLFLLPWVFLYGITGAMFNHQGLLPEVTTQHVDSSRLESSTLSDFPSPEVIAEQVVQSLQLQAGDQKITLAANHGAEFTNEILFEIKGDGDRTVVHINPMTKNSKVVTHPHNPEIPEALLKGVHKISISPDPHEYARSSVAEILNVTGKSSTQAPQPLGWTKLNFLAEVNGEPARVTYVLKDGHVDVTRFLGEDGMTPRHFFLRLHTSHGQPPHWNGRALWSLVIDVMAIAMVTWGVSGLFMWWQIKRTRFIGSMVIVLSLLTATFLYFNMMDFYAATKL